MFKQFCANGIFCLFSVCLLSGCGRSDSPEEQKITIRVDAPDPEIKPDSPAVAESRKEPPVPVGGSALEEESVPEQMKQLISRMAELRPHIQKIMEDPQCRKLVKDRKSDALAAVLHEDHLETIEAMAGIMGVKDTKIIAKTTALHLVRKGDMSRSQGPNRPLKRPRVEQ